MVGRGRQDQDPSPGGRSPLASILPPPPSVPGGGRPHLAVIQQRGWLAAATKAEQGLFIDSGTEPPPPAGPHCPPLRTLALPVLGTSQSPSGPGPGGRTHTDPHSTPRSRHTLSRLWAWVRGDSSCSTRRSWGAASESIATFAPLTQSGPQRPGLREGLTRGTAPKPGSRPRFTDAGTEARRRDVAHPGCRRPRRPCVPCLCLCRPAPSRPRRRSHRQAPLPHPNQRRGLAGADGGWGGWDETAPPVRSLGNSRLEIGPRAEPPESCCGGQGRA